MEMLKKHHSFTIKPNSDLVKKEFLPHNFRCNSCVFQRNEFFCDFSAYNASYPLFGCCVFFRNPVHAHTQNDNSGKQIIRTANVISATFKKKLCNVLRSKKSFIPNHEVEVFHSQQKSGA